MDFERNHLELAKLLLDIMVNAKIQTVNEVHTVGYNKAPLTAFFFPNSVFSIFDLLELFLHMFNHQRVC